MVRGSGTSDWKGTIFAEEEDADGADDMDDAGLTRAIRGFGRALGRSSCEAGSREEGAVESAFIARDRTGAAAGRLPAAAGLLTVDREPAGTRALAGVPDEAAALAGAALLGPGAAAGAEGALLLAFSINGIMVALEAGFSPDVWSMTKSAPVLATTKGKTALAAFRTSPFLSSRQWTTGLASGCRSDVDAGGSAANFSANHPSTAARRTGLAVSQLVARPLYSESSPPDASAIEDRVASAVVLVVAF